MTNLDPPLGPLSQERSWTIPIQEFDAGLAQWEFQSPQWYLARFGEACRMFTQSAASRQFLAAMLNYLTALRNSGGDASIPLVLVGATMLQMGYAMGRKHAEAEILEGWMRL